MWQAVKKVGNYSIRPTFHHFFSEFEIASFVSVFHNLSFFTLLCLVLRRLMGHLLGHCDSSNILMKLEIQSNEEIESKPMA